MQIGMVGLGRMGGNMVRRLMRDGHTCVVYDRAADAVATLKGEGATGAGSLAEFVTALTPPRAICLMIPAALVDRVVDELAPLLQRGDTLIDGGNSHYQDAIARSKRLAPAGLHWIDMGTSGGVWGLDRGYCLMVGGEPDAVARLEPFFTTLAPGAGSITPTPSARPGTQQTGWLHCGPSGAGHFVKMVHNGIEYGLMAAYAEGLNLLSRANAGNHPEAADAETAPLRNPEFYQYELDVAAITEVWRRGSVIASWLLDLTAAAFAKDPRLGAYSGTVSDSGEGRWTLQAAIDVGVPANVLAAALYERFASRGNDDFQNRVLSAMRHAFGGHLERSS